MSSLEDKEMLDEVKKNMTKNPTRALEIVQSVLRNDPATYNALILEGIVLQRMNTKDNDKEKQALAFESFKKALHYHPDVSQISSVVWREIIFHFTRQALYGEDPRNIENDLKYFLKCKPFVETLGTELRSTNEENRQLGIEAVSYMYKKYLSTELAIGFPNILKEEVIKCYDRGFGDKVKLQELITTSFIPCYHNKNDAENKVSCTLELYGSLSQDGKKIFESIVTARNQIRKNLIGFITAAINCKGKGDQAKLNLQMKNVIASIPEVGNASKVFIDFGAEIKQNDSLAKLINIILGPNSSANEIKTGLIELRNLTKKKPYSKILHSLIYRAVEVIFDSEFMETLERCILKMIKRESTHQFFEDIGLSQVEAIEAGLQILHFLICSINYVNKIRDGTVPHLVKLFKILSDGNLHYPLGCLAKIAKENRNQISMQAETIITKSTSLLFHPVWPNAKNAVHCLYYSLPEDERVETFKKILNENIPSYLEQCNVPICTTAIKILGQIAVLFPTNFKNEMKNIINGIIVGKLILRPSRTEDDLLHNTKQWTDDSKSLPQSTQNIIAGFKTLAQWLINIGQSPVRASKILNMLTHFISTSGESTSEDVVPFNESEKSWIRLSAGKSFLHLCHSGHEIGQTFYLQDWYKLSELMIDPELGVRKIFGEKLTKYLTKGFPDGCLPLPFMGFYALAGYETNPKLRNQMKKSYEEKSKQRRSYMVTLKEAMPNIEEKYLRELLPDNIVIYAIQLLANSSKFTSTLNMAELKALAEALWFILEPLVKHPDFNFQYYDKISNSLRRCKAKVQTTRDVDKKMWAICEIMMCLIGQRSKKLNTTIPCPTTPFLSGRFVEKHPDPGFKNEINYLPGILLAPDAFKRKFHIGKSASETEIALNSDVEIEESDDESGPKVKVKSPKKKTTPKKKEPKKIDLLNDAENAKNKPQNKKITSKATDEVEVAAPKARGTKKPSKKIESEAIDDEEIEVTAPKARGTKKPSKKIESEAIDDEEIEVAAPKARGTKKPSKKIEPEAIVGDDDVEIEVFAPKVKNGSNTKKPPSGKKTTKPKNTPAPPKPAFQLSPEEDDIFDSPDPFKSDSENSESETAPKANKTIEADDDEVPTTSAKAREVQTKSKSRFIPKQLEDLWRQDMQERQLKKEQPKTQPGKPAPKSTVTIRKGNKRQAPTEYRPKILKTKRAKKDKESSEDQS